MEAETSLKIEQVKTPEFGEGTTVCVRELTGDERDLFDQLVTDREGKLRGLRAELVAIGLCSESGESLGFTAAEVKQLGEKSGAAIDRMFERIRDLSGMGPDAHEEAVKNSQADQSENSG